MQTERHADVIVVGAGIMGAAVAWQLSRRGAHIVLFEQFQISHSRGSSHGASRIFRLAYDQVEYVRLAQSALDSWHELQQVVGRELLLPTGAMDAGPPVHLGPIETALAQASVHYERLDPSESAQRFPAFHLPEGWETLSQSDGGVLLARDCLSALLTDARQHGVEIHEGTRVTKVNRVADSVTVTAGGERWRAEQVVLACAAWSNDLLEQLDLPIPLRITREHVAYYPVREPSAYVPFIWHGGSASPELYGLPNGRTGTVKVGWHGVGPVTDPHHEGAVQPDLLDSVHAFVRTHLPGLEPMPTAMETCLYASTPDDNFVLDRSGPVVVAAGFGGHGFKFAPAIGASIADLVLGVGSGPSPRFRHARFAGTAAPVPRGEHGSD